jgi:hypothetical protein
MTHMRRLVLGTVVTTAIIGGTAALSAWPSYRAIPEGTGVVKLSFSHGGERNCREMTEAERAKLPANMRKTETCDRQRPPLYVELDLDGVTVFSAELPPGGIAGDGPSRVYQKFLLPIGAHDVAIRLRDTARAEGFDYSAERHFSLAEAQSFSIDFRPVAGGFLFN